jgi:hypothetical protein
MPSIRTAIMTELDAVLASLAELENRGLIESEETRIIVRNAISAFVVAIEAIEARLAALENASRRAKMN